MNSTQLSLVIPSFLLSLSLSLPSPPSFSAWCQVWGLRSVPKCLQSTELQTSLQHFFQLDCCDLIFLITFFKESFFIAFFFFFFSGRFSNRFFSAVSPHLHHHPIRLFLFLFQVSIKKSINRKREDFFLGRGGQYRVRPPTNTARRRGGGSGWDMNRRRGRSSSQTWLIHHMWACFYIKIYLKD